ncbi:MAG: DUF6460 domain-containing protein [Alphaproteobacteria bacterium]|nr:DUF6460 domain-containing protein [Alphaproteobacteria bacterium]
MQNIFGGPIVPTLLRLAILSFIVGLTLFFLGIDPVDLWRNFGKTIQETWSITIDALNWASGYAILGAIVVIPIWIIYRAVLFLTQSKS